MKKVKSSKISKIKDPDVNDVLKLMLKNSATKSDIKKLEEKLGEVETNIRVDIKEEFKKYATREEMYSMKNEIIDVVNQNTNKVLAALVQVQSSNEKRFLEIEERVL